MNNGIIIEAVKACIRKANAMFDVNIPVDTIKIDFMQSDEDVASAWFDPRKRVANRFGIEFNQFGVETNLELMLRVIVPHEVAHLVMHYKQEVQGLLPYARVHGKEWKTICQALGGIKSEMAPVYTEIPCLLRDSYYHKATTNTKFVVFITRKRYNQIQQGERFRIPQTLEVIGKKNVSKVPVKRSQLISERKLCYIRQIIRV